MQYLRRPILQLRQDKDGMWSSISCVAGEVAVETLARKIENITLWTDNCWPKHDEKMTEDCDIKE